MPLNATLLEILVCPDDKSTLSYADEETLKRLNLRIDEGSLLNRGGKKVTEHIDEGLVRADGLFLYPVRDEIPVMLVDEAIPLEQLRV